nr:hypothetical protein [Tanacetum cinerariifolium]
MAFVSSPTSTNEVDTASIQASAASTPVSTKSGKKITINGSDTAGYDKTKVECFNCHKMEHFTREYISPINQESMPRNQDSSRKTVIVKDTSSKAMMAIDGAGFDLSYLGLFAPLTIDLSCSGLEEFKQPEFESYGPKASKSVCIDTSNVVKKVFDAPIIEDWVFDYDEDESEEVAGDPQAALRDTRIFDSGCSRHMTGNKSILSDYQEYEGGFVAFAGSSKGGKITSKCKIRTRKLDFEDVYFVKELKFNLFSVSQMCDKKNSVLFTETECLIFSPDFKLLDENQVLLKIDNGTEFKNYEMNQFCGIKGITREFSNARTPQKNGFAKRKNRALIEAARTMLADSLLPIPFWALAVNTACYVQNKVLLTKPHNKTPYELLIGRPPIISFMRPFGCPVTILNTLDHLGKFDGKDDEGFLFGYSLNSKAFRVYNSITKKVEENLHVNFLENKQNVTGSGQEWLFDIDSLTNSMNYPPVSAGNRTNGIAGSKIHSDVGQEGKEKVSDQEYILLQVLNTSSKVPSSNEEVKSSPKDDDGKKSIVELTCVEGGNIDDLGMLRSTDEEHR